MRYNHSIQRARRTIDADSPHFTTNGVEMIKGVQTCSKSMHGEPRPHDTTVTIHPMFMDMGDKETAYVWYEGTKND